MKRSIFWNLLMLTPLVAILMACPKPVNPSEVPEGSGQDLQITPVSIYPRVVDYGVYSRQMIGGTFRFCGSVRMADGSAIDLRDPGCPILASGIQPPRYFAWISVENPSNEAITYDWDIYVTVNPGQEWRLNGVTASTSQVFYLPHPRFNHGTYTSDCRLTVKVNAPNPRRSKGPFSVWTGRCTYTPST